MLFLDEFTEFRRDAIEGLRQPLEDGGVVVTRAIGSVEFPARFTLVAAANPCPCGFEGDPRRHCRCRSDRVDQYRQKLSGPLLDRIDLRLRVPRLTKQELMGSDQGEPSSAIRERVQARPRSPACALGATWACRATRTCPGRSLGAGFGSTSDAERLLGGAVDQLGLTGRGFDRAIKVARTVADLDGAEVVEPHHVAEALSYRDGVVLEGLARAG